MRNASVLPWAIQKWLHYEQVVNDQIYDPSLLAALKINKRTFSKKYWAVSQNIWELEAIVVPKNETRSYGPYRRIIEKSLLLKFPNQKEILFVHPQAKKGFNRLIQKYGIQKTGILVTPTSGFRTLLAWNPRRPKTPLLLKLSLFCHISGVYRTITERKVVGPYLLSKMMEKISNKTKKEIKFDYFPKVGGLVHKTIQAGYVVRTFPKSWNLKGQTTLVPFFSLYSKDGKKRPILVRAMQKSKKNPENYLFQKVIRPLVRVGAYFLFREGMNLEFHGQNYLMEIDGKGRLKDKIYIRDFEGIVINIPYRKTLQKNFPLPKQWMDPTCPNFLALTTLSHWAKHGSTQMIEEFGLGNILWHLHRSIKRYFPKISKRTLNLSFLKEWQNMATRILQVKPMIEKGGIAMDEALECYLTRQNWETDAMPISKNLQFKNIFPLFRFSRKKYFCRSVMKEGVTTPWGFILLRKKKPYAFLPFRIRDVPSP